MNAIKTFTCAVTAAAALAFCTSSARATFSITTNDIILNLTLTVSTNGEDFVSNTNYTWKVGQVKFANKNLLQLLGGGNGFSDEVFSNGDQIAIAYDAPWYGDVVVVDKTGHRVLYDATLNNGNTNATLAINLLYDTGTFSKKYDFKPSGSDSFTFYDGGSFTLLDNTNNINIAGSGPSTFTFTQTLNSSTEFNNTNQFGPWTASITFDFFGANGESAEGQNNVTISGTVTGKGSGKGEAIFNLAFFVL